MSEIFRLSPLMASRKLQALAFIEQYYSVRGTGPSLSELAAALNCNRSRAQGAVRQLAREGRIRHAPSVMGERGSLGPDLDLGEPQWAVCFGDAEAHWFVVHKDNAHRVVTTCGRAIMKPLLYHPGSFPLCRHCASRHRAPSRRFLSNGVIDWLSRPPAPPYADRTHPNAQRR